MENGFSFLRKENNKNYYRSRMEGKMKRKNWIAGVIIHGSNIYSWHGFCRQYLD